MISKLKVISSDLNKELWKKYRGWEEMNLMNPH